MVVVAVVAVAVVALVQVAAGAVNAAGATTAATEPKGPPPLPPPPAAVTAAAAAAAVTARAMQAGLTVRGRTSYLLRCVLSCWHHSQHPHLQLDTAYRGRRHGCVCCALPATVSGVTMP